jgi:hypothetical protein
MTASSRRTSSGEETRRWYDLPRLYWESKHPFFETKGVELPVGVTVLPNELYPAPRSWAEQAYPKLIHYNNDFEEGGHFAAWEQPEIFSKEVRDTFRSLR